MKKILKLIYLIPCLALIAGCTDELLTIGPDGFPEGDTLIECQMDFEPFVEQNTRASQAAPSTGFDDVRDLVVIAYDNEGNLMDGFPMEITKSEHNLDITDAPRNDGNAANGQTSDKATKRATFRLRLPYGRYYLYGVSNLGSFDSSDVMLESTMSFLNRHRDEVANRESFLAIKRDWDKGNYRNNREMLGYFVETIEKQAPSTGTQTYDKKVTIDRPGMTIHSWLRRSVAKITIDFDGKELSDNIKIYVRRATIHDIPAGTTLGKVNRIDSKENMITNKTADNRPLESGAVHWISYGEGDYNSYTQWPFVSRDHPKITDDAGKVIDFHAADQKCLSLYENMQGDGDEKNWKPQEPDPSGGVADSDDKKDNMEYGSYIEVECYYQLTSSTDTRKGRLIYRFMLGKDIKNNFDVERNYHYKVTMCPRGYGNDVDWHIEYMEKEHFEVKNPYYVSYLYNHDSTIRFRYTPVDGQKVVGLKAQIVGNNWWQDDAIYPSTAPYTPKAVINRETPTSTSQAELMVSPNTAKFDKNKYSNTDAKLNGKTKYLGNGFLSLHPTGAVRDIKYGDCDSDPKWQLGSAGATFYTNNNQEGELLNDKYFYGQSEKSNGIDRSYREFDFKKPEESGMTATIETEPQTGAVKINLPMWTRAKNLIKPSGHTANNPFAGHTRSAYVKLTVVLEDKNGNRVPETAAHSEVVRVEQVKRIVNPKAIYRSSKRNENFDVTLMELDNEYATEFSPVESDGPWMAEVLSNDANFINLNGRRTIKGNGKISFQIRFNKMNRDEVVRNAIVRVRYNNYACVHLIFVRQGYKEQALTPGGDEWRTLNILTKNTEVSDPRDEGSMFVFGNLDNPFDAINNDPPVATGGMILPSHFVAKTKLYLANDDGSIDTEKGKTNSVKGATPGTSFAGLNVASTAQFQKLFRDETNQIQQGFGVLYADGATKTAEKVADAYGWSRHDTSEDRNTKGMRGVIVYNNTNYRNLFFPIGRSGYGCRKQDGTLRYANQTNYFHHSHGLDWLWSAPLFFEQFSAAGAIYYARWLNNAPMEGANGNMEAGAQGLDINYQTFDFNLITTGNINKGKDACFLRCVGKTMK